MTIALVLTVYAVLLATAGAWGLSRAGWVDRAPRLGIGAWQALTASVLVATVFAGAALTVPVGRVSGGIAGLLAACVMALRAQYATPAGVAMGAVGAVLVVAVSARFAFCLARELQRAARWRRDHRAALALLGRPDARLGAVVVEHAAPVAYCMPGRRQRIVLTTGVLNGLDAAQLDAVVAHERAHLRGRHHLVIAAAAATARAFPRVPVFARAHAEIVRLVELAADDAAARTTERLALAEALLVLGGPASGTPEPVVALAANGSPVAARVRRMIGPRGRLGRALTALALTAIAAVLAMPLVVASTPAIATVGTRCCPGDRAASFLGAPACEMRADDRCAVPPAGPCATRNCLSG